MRSFHLLSPASRASAIPILFTIWLIAIGLVIFGSLLPASSVHELKLDLLIETQDKHLHFLSYMFLALLPMLWTANIAFGLTCSASMIPLGICVEFAQRLVPGRAFDVDDILANTAGVLVGVVIGSIVRGRLQSSISA